MGISNAMNNAASGLRANSRLIDSISNNVANELTPGYARRVTELSSATINGYGSGVVALATTRVEDALLTSERRVGDASAAASTVKSNAYSSILAAMGEPGKTGAVATLVTDLETALMAAAAAPQSQASLQNVASSAEALADGLNKVAAANRTARAEADAEIARQVTGLNANLNRVDELNRKIAAMNVQGVDTLSLQDQRAQVIDQISSVVPVRTVARENGAIALYTQTGGLLLDGQVYEMSFEATGDVITPDMTVGNGLSGLRQNQGGLGTLTNVTTSGANSAIAGGSLAALFEVRDSIVPGFDAEVDRLAAELIDRFDGVQTGGANDGLLVDTDPAAGVLGIAARIKLSAAVDPDQGGSLAVLRSGIATTESTETGYGNHLQRLAEALSAARTPVGWTTQVAAADAGVMASNLASYYATHANSTESDRAFMVARQASLAEQEQNRTGVDSDTELQTLMVVEQAYSANARVMTVIDDLMQTLLEI